MELYNYKIQEVVRVVDGDTIYFKLALGFDIEMTKSFRLLGIDTPEISGIERPAGLVSKAYVIKRLGDAVSVGKHLYLKSDKDRTGKYGRYLATVFIQDLGSISLEGTNLNQELIDMGLAVPYTK